MTSLERDKIETSLTASKPLDQDERPWGRWEEYINEVDYRVKRLLVLPGKRLSLQRHQLRTEEWVVVKGSGVVTLDALTHNVQAGDTISIARQQIHRLENTGSEDLIVIETQLGTCLEDDIERLEDDWNRK